MDKKDKIRAILLSHGHEDHISGLPFHYEALGSPVVYTSKLTTMFVENKFKEFRKPADVKEIEYAKEYKFGGFTVSFIHMTHSIPDTMHILIKTPIGNLYHGTDFKMDLTPPFGEPPDFYGMTKAGHEGVLCLMSDSLGSEREGYTLSESIVGETFENQMQKTKGKFIMTTFSSNISRIRQCVDAAIKYNRKIIFLGRSMRENTRLASEIGYLPIPHGFLAKEDEGARLPPNKICLIVAGSQGQYDSALFKLANKQNKFMQIKTGDKVIFSSDPVPGNENEVNALIEELVLQGADVVYSGIQDALHASGHGNQEDIKLLVRFTKPQFLLPIGSTIRHQRQYQKLCMTLGYQKDDVYLLNEGETVWFTRNKVTRGETIETKNIYVDAYGVGDVGSVVLRDRQTLSSEGMVVVVLTMDGFGKLISRPKLLSKGFVFEQGEDEMFEGAMVVIEKLLKPRDGRISDMSTLKKSVASHLEDYFFKQRGRNPLIIVDTVEV